MKIIVCDDYKPIHLIFAGIAKTLSRPLQIISAFTGSELEDLIVRHQDVSAIFLDIRMPMLRGDEFLARHQDTGLIAKIVLMSGEPSDVIDALKSKYQGLRYTLAKPVSVASLSSAVTAILAADG